MATRSARAKKALATPPKGQAPDLAVVSSPPVSKVSLLDADGDVVEDVVAAPTGGIDASAVSVPEVSHTPGVVARAGGHLVQALTGRTHRVNVPMSRVTISVPAALLARIDAVDAALTAAAGRVTVVNRSALLEEAARRVAASPEDFPPVTGTMVEAGVPLHATCPTDIWEAAGFAAYATYRSKQPGKSLAAAATTVLDDISVEAGVPQKV